MIKLNNPPSNILIGQTGENEFKTIDFDVTDWLTLFPDGACSIIFKRPDGMIYVVVANSTEKPGV